MYKQAMGIMSGINAANKMLVDNPIAKPIFNYTMWKDLATEVVKHTPEKTTFHVPFAGFKVGETTGSVHKGLKSVATKYKSLPEKTRSNLQTAQKTVDKIGMAQNVVSTAKFVGDMTGAGKTTGEQNAMAQKRMNRQFGSGSSYSGDLKDLASTFNPNLSPSTPTSMGTFSPTLLRYKRASEELPNRPAYSFEKEGLNNICHKYPSEYFLRTKKDLETLRDRLINQDTRIFGDNGDMLGFINSGIRELPEFAKKPIYIRIVYVCPKHGGKGIASKMIEQTLKEASVKSWNPSDGAWIQICENNNRMQKVAAKTGFTKVTTWDIDNEYMGIWYKDK